MEDKAVTDLREAIPYCESVRDFVSRDLLSRILRNEEEHIDFIETQFELIRRIGVEKWMQLNSGPPTESRHTIRKLPHEAMTANAASGTQALRMFRPAMAATDEANDTHPGRDRGLHAGHAVFDHHAC